MPDSRARRNLDVADHHLPRQDPTLTDSSDADTLEDRFIAFADQAQIALRGYGVDPATWHHQLTTLSQLLDELDTAVIDCCAPLDIQHLLARAHDQVPASLRHLIGAPATDGQHACVGTETEPATRVFELHRDFDVTGYSGTGIVADGIIWPDGRVCMQWRGQIRTLVIAENIDEIATVHGHDGRTHVVFPMPFNSETPRGTS